MKATYIDYKDTKSFSSTVIRYLDQDTQLQPFISAQPTPEGFKHILENRKAPADRQVLADILNEQYARTNKPGSYSRVHANIELLRS
ncbi:MAG TPA: bacillithiol biosynthesis BshC, partial [Sphingobacteriaceae bacterium]